MATHDDFTPVEWMLLVELPIRVIASAVNAERDGSLGTTREMVAGLTGFSGGAAEYPENRLIQAVFEEYKRDGEGEARALELSEHWLENLIPETIERARQVSELLARKSDGVEVAEFKRWLVDTAEGVTTAADSWGSEDKGSARRKGRFCGICGTHWASSGRWPEVDIMPTR